MSNILQSPRGLIVNSTDICVGTHRANAAYTAQSGKKAQGNPALRAQCKEAKHKKKKNAKRRKRGGRR
jgi:hypothetical protein